MNAAEALKLPRAEITDDEIAEVRGVLVEIDNHIRQKMTFAGVMTVDVPVRLCTTDSVAKAVCIILTRLKWNASTQLMSLPPRVQGGPPTPHHWTFLLYPMAEAYSEEILEQQSLLS